VILALALVAACGEAAPVVEGGAYPYERDASTRQSSSGAPAATGASEVDASTVTLEPLTVAEYLGYEDAVLSREREMRLHDRVESELKSCMGESGQPYSEMPFDALPPLDQTSPAEYAASEGFGVVASSLAALEQAAPEDDQSIADPNFDYVQSLSETDRTTYFETLVRCAEVANEATFGPIRRAREAVAPYLEASAEAMQVDARYVEAYAEWGACVSSVTETEIDDPSDLQKYVESNFALVAADLSAQADVTALRALQEREIAVASAIQSCDTALATRLDPLVREYESTLLAEHTGLFDALLSELNR
jgi:hypothetical protein